MLLKWFPFLSPWLLLWVYIRGPILVWLTMCVHGFVVLIVCSSYVIISCESLSNLGAARFGFRLFPPLRNLTGASAALLPRCLSNFRIMRSSWHPISWLRDFVRLGSKTSYRLVNRGHGEFVWSIYPCSPGSLYWYRESDHWPGPRLNIKTVLSTYGDFHVKDKTTVRTSYLKHGNRHTW